MKKGNQSINEERHMKISKIFNSFFINFNMSLNLLLPVNDQLSERKPTYK